MMYKYKYASFVNKNGQKVISARATYAGKTVKGYAKCDPRDEYDEEKGKELAAARCEARIAKKRMNYSIHKVAEARKKVIAAQRELEKMLYFQADATHMAESAELEVAKILKKLG